MGAIQDASSPTPTPAAPPRLPKRPPLIKGLLLARDNVLAIWPREAFVTDVLKRKLLLRWLFVANSPDAVRHVLVTNIENYRKGSASMRVMTPILGQGLLTSHGDLWKRQRRIAQPSFHHSRLRGYAETIAQAAREMVARWAAIADGTTIEVSDEMTRVTLEAVSRTMFSDDLGGRAKLVADSIVQYQHTWGKVDVGTLLGLPGWFPRWRSRAARQALERLNEVIDGIIARRIADHGDREDLLATLLDWRDPATGDPMAGRQVRDEVATIFINGHETTANALMWTWYLLSDHPAEEGRLQEEVDRVLGGRVPTYDDVPNLRYTRWVFEEALRLYPPIPTMTWEALADDEIGGHHVPAGSLVVVSPWLLHRRKGIWRNPDRFDPERFSPEQANRHPKNAYIPFSLGPRSCAGEHFAMLEAILIIASVAQRFSLRLEPGYRVEPVGLMSLRPRGGLPMRLQRRR